MADVTDSADIAITQSHQLGLTIEAHNIEMVYISKSDLAAIIHRCNSQSLEWSLFSAMLAVFLSSVALLVGADLGEEAKNFVRPIAFFCVPIGCYFLIKAIQGQRASNEYLRKYTQPKGD